MTLSRRKLTKLAHFWAFFVFAFLCGLGIACAYTANELNTISVYETVAPSVVNITTQTCEPESFFCIVPPATGSGSGIIVGADGTIVTSYHLISKAQNIEVALFDGRRLPGEVIGSAPEDDLAIIRIKPGSRPLREIMMGNSRSLRVGEKVLAIGNPFGLGQTLTVGVVSMVDRSIKRDGAVLKNVIQVSASINPGNTGGALVNSAGELVGMNSAIFSTTGGSVGIGFAIPVNRIKEVTPGLVYNYGKLLGWVAGALLLFLVARKIASL
jgi:S1-C subfamily serine protease